MNESLDTGSPVGRFVAHLMASLAALEAETISERTKGALAEVAWQGRARSRFLPFGWRLPGGGTESKGDRRRLVPHRGEQRLLGRMLALQRKGLGPLRIANRLNAAGLVNRSGRGWTLGNVRAVLATAARRARVDGWGAAPRSSEVRAD